MTIVILVFLLPEHKKNWYFFFILSGQSLYDIEMATGTRLMIESGAASAREYTAPDQYFYNLLESFESRMATYRRLIEDTEGYIVGAQQGSTVTPKGIKDILFIFILNLHRVMQCNFSLFYLGLYTYCLPIGKKFLVFFIL